MRRKWQRKRSEREKKRKIVDTTAIIVKYYTKRNIVLVFVILFYLISPSKQCEWFFRLKFLIWWSRALESNCECDAFELFNWQSYIKSCERYFIGDSNVGAYFFLLPRLIWHFFFSVHSLFRHTKKRKKKKPKHSCVLCAFYWTMIFVFEFVQNVV